VRLGLRRPPALRAAPAPTRREQSRRGPAPRDARVAGVRVGREGRHGPPGRSSGSSNSATFLNVHQEVPDGLSPV